MLEVCDEPGRYCVDADFVGVVWAMAGYSFAFAPGNGFVGDSSRLFLRGVGLDPNGTIPHLLFMCYQATFCIITAALISGAIVERMPFTLLGAGVLWFGWFGFNAGSAVASNGIAALAFTATMLAPAGTLVVWTLLDAIVVGLVAITPAAGYVGPMSAIAIGAIAAVPSYFGLIVRARTGLDDSLDVVAAHGLGGTVGALLTGVFAQKAMNGVADGLLFGNPGQLGIQAVAVVAAIAYSGVMSFVLLKLVGLVFPLRADAADESEGLDMSQHGEEAYVHAEGSGTLASAAPSRAIGAAHGLAESHSHPDRRDVPHPDRRGGRALTRASQC